MAILPDGVRIEKLAEKPIEELTRDELELVIEHHELPRWKIIGMSPDNVTGDPWLPSGIVELLIEKGIITKEEMEVAHLRLKLAALREMRDQIIKQTAKSKILVPTGIDASKL